MIEDWTNVTRTIRVQEGDLVIRGVTAPEILDRLHLDLRLKAFRPAKKQQEALAAISRLKNGKVATASLKDEIVGYVTFHPPDEFERWSAGPGNVLELGAIEVSPQVRKYGVAKTLLEVSFEDPLMDKYIVLSTEYYWHWDLEGTGLQIWEYREIMRRLMEHVSLEIKDTDEDEIASHPANMLMVRYGKHVTDSEKREFEKLLFLE